MMSKLVAPLLAVLAVTAVACGDITRPKAALPTGRDSTVIYALNGAPPGAPTAIYLPTASAVQADGNFRFDVAFDIDPNGKVLLLPLRTVATNLSQTYRVGLQTSTRAFDSLLIAPKSGYHYDSTLVVTPGTTVVVETQDVAACGLSYVGSTMYGKIVVDSINAAKRLLYTRFVVDPNCGFYSLGPGVPKE